MAKLAELRKQAKGMGIAPTMIRACNTTEELEAVIRGFGGDGNGDAPKAAKKHAVKKAVAKKKGKSTKSASSKTAPVAKKSAKAGKTKRPSAAKSTSVKGTDGPSGRHVLDGVDFSHDDGWNARDGSAPDRIIKALKRFKGNRDKVYDHLEADVWDFVGKKKRNGEKRTKDEARDMLVYRIARTAWDFAMRTGQHEKSENRVQYGSGGTGQGVWKPKKGNSKATKTTKGTSKRKTATSKKAGTKKASAKKSTTKKGKKSGKKK